MSNSLPGPSDIHGPATHPQPGVPGGPTGYPAPESGSHAPNKRGGGCLKWALIIGGACLGLIILMSLIGSLGKSNDTSSSKTTPSATPSIAQPTASETAVAPTEEASATPEPEVTTPAAAAPSQPAVSAVNQAALNKANQYASVMHMSKQGVYDQLVSEYGEKFTPEAAQYAIDNMKADWNANALAKAKVYQKQMSMSPSAIYDQLVSEYGEKFTPAEAQYAVDHLTQ
ncbi:hypothetical protein GCM10009595_18920 [Falsarthrobacter nasiphocae]